MDDPDKNNIVLTRRWPRISLRGLLLSIAIATVVASHMWTSYRLHESQQEVLELRRAAGLLTVDDPETIYVLPIELHEPMTWRYKVHLPESHEYGLFTTFGSIPERGFPSEHNWELLWVGPGENTITAKVQKNEHGKWIVGMYSSQGGS